ncbi:Ribosomal-L16 domain-containing protein [Aphelenchoides besseyi]|nr:Ribosomal-L16 domain-containing protein [Aphelenchoides besseyi]
MSGCLLTPTISRVIVLRGFKRNIYPVTFENVVFPPDGQTKLPPMPTEPFYDSEAGEAKFKTTKRMVEARGVEEVHNTLIHKQYGLAAVSGGFIGPKEFKLMTTSVNKNLAPRQFAIWRVPAPWLPRTKKAQGTKLGGGKGSIHHYVTPVRSGRIIFEIGGHITDIEARAYLSFMPDFLPFQTEFVSEEILQKRRDEEREIELYNQNPYNWDHVIKYNMQNCCGWLSQYDIIWRGKYNIKMAVGDDELLRFSFRYVVYTIAGLPLTALGLCLMISILLHWDEATRTHCNVANWLPSVSAAVASYSPERYIWRLFIGIHGAPRIAVAFAFRNLLLSSPLGPTRSVIWFPVACHIACILNVLEVMFLLMLTSISSVDDYTLHKSSFVGFAICGVIYMFLSTWLFDYSGRRRTSALGERSFQYKLFCCALSTGSLFTALYFFYRHNTYCEPGIYTLFALCEYSVIIFNILFHSTLYYDFHSRNICLLSSASTFQYEALPTHYSHDEKVI